MSRPNLKPGEGMLFAFPEERPWPIWTKNVNFPMDVIWLNASGVVVHAARAPPCRADPCPVYAPPVPAFYVVETVAGFAANYSIGPGTKATIQGAVKGR